MKAESYRRVNSDQELEQGLGSFFSKFPMVHCEFDDDCFTFYNPSIVYKPHKEQSQKLLVRLGGNGYGLGDQRKLQNILSNNQMQIHQAKETPILLANCP